MGKEGAMALHDGGTLEESTADLPLGKDTTSIEGVRVFVRVRPPNNEESKAGVAVTTPPDGTTLVIDGKDHTVRCEYDEVFGEASTQAQIFDKVKPAIAQVVHGYNACIYAYGQTGSGKTHTMLGPEGGRIQLRYGGHMEEHWGLIPRVVSYLHEQLLSLSTRGTVSFSLHCSYMQIYNERLHDLLQEQGFRDNLEIHEMPRGKYRGEIYVSGLAEFRVKDVEDVLELVQLGNRNRAIRATECNEVSSRSHAILQLLVEVETRGVNGQRTMKRAKLSLVDLAGSEKINKKADMSAHHLRELTCINKSLSALGNVIAALTEKKRSHIPYRDSKLTRLMQDCLGGNCRTVVIACISPGKAHCDESISTSQFADRAKNVMIRIKANEVVDDKAAVNLVSTIMAVSYRQVLLARAHAEIARLKMLLKQNATEGVEGSNHGTSTSTSTTNNIITSEASEIATLMAENTALRAEVKRLKMELGMRNRRKRSGSIHLYPPPSSTIKPPPPSPKPTSGSLRAKYSSMPSAKEKREGPEEDEEEEEEEERMVDSGGGGNDTSSCIDEDSSAVLSTSHRTTPPPPAAAQRVTGKKKGVGKGMGCSIASMLRREEEHLVSIREERKKLEIQLAALQAQRGQPSSTKTTKKKRYEASPSSGAYSPLGWEDEGGLPAGAPPSRTTSTTTTTRSNQQHQEGRRRRTQSLSSLTSVLPRPGTGDMRKKTGGQKRSSLMGAKAEGLAHAYRAMVGKGPGGGGSSSSSNNGFSPAIRSNNQGGCYGEDKEAFGDGIPTPRIRGNISDLGLRVKIYSYRYDQWNPCTIIGYDRIRKLHYVRYENTGDKQWHLLANKKVEVVGTIEQPSPYPTTSTTTTNNRPSSSSSPPAGAVDDPLEASYEEETWETEEQPPRGPLLLPAGGEGQHIHLTRYPKGVTT